jgi:hypothetical protein
MVEARVGLRHGIPERANNVSGKLDPLENYIFPINFRPYKISKLIFSDIWDWANKLTREGTQVMVQFHSISIFRFG